MLHYRAIASSRLAKTSDILLCILGIVGMVYTTVLTISSWLHGGVVKSPGYCDEK
jgi:solute carrier family 36 (proton-coupled amino acid transporter)